MNLKVKDIRLIVIYHTLRAKYNKPISGCHTLRAKYGKLILGCHILRTKYDKIVLKQGFGMVFAVI